MNGKNIDIIVTYLGIMLMWEQFNYYQGKWMMQVDTHKHRSRLLVRWLLFIHNNLNINKFYKSVKMLCMHFSIFLRLNLNLNEQIVEAFVWACIEKKNNRQRSQQQQINWKKIAGCAVRLMFWHTDEYWCVFF